jgi:ABC-type multidrug transport system fused ATPase/permease subunit
MPIESNIANNAPDFNKPIKFENIEFSYPSRPENLVLKDISLTLEPGKTIALVGPSGSGKSTIASLIYQFYKPTNGQIKLGNSNINDLNFELYLSKIDSVKDNLKRSLDLLVAEDYIYLKFLKNEI